MYLSRCWSAVWTVRAPVSLGDHLVELAAPGGNQGKLGGNEEPVQRHQSKYGNHAGRRHNHRRRIDCLRSNKYEDHMPVIYSILYSSRDLGACLSV
jgi:hypothetical protein